MDTATQIATGLAIVTALALGVALGRILWSRYEALFKGLWVKHQRLESEFKIQCARIAGLLDDKVALACKKSALEKDNDALREDKQKMLDRISRLEIENTRFRAELDRSDKKA